jgi:5-methylcytosine-specific restriction endonuclease McrA
MAKSTPIDTSYALRKWTKEEKQQVIDLREKGFGPKRIAKATDFPIDQIRFWIYGDRKKKRTKSKKSKNAKANDQKHYYRLKYNNWFSWKAGCYRASLVKASGKKEAATKAELEKLLMDCSKKCVYCGEELVQENISLDHQTPLARGGSSKISNLVLCCKSCNLAKGSLNDEEYEQLLKCISKWEDGGKHLLGRLKGSNRFFVGKGGR